MTTLRMQCLTKPLFCISERSSRCSTEVARLYSLMKRLAARMISIQGAIVYNILKLR